MYTSTSPNGSSWRSMPSQRLSSALHASESTQLICVMPPSTQLSYQLLSLLLQLALEQLAVTAAGGGELTRLVEAQNVHRPADAGEDGVVEAGIRRGRARLAPSCYTPRRPELSARLRLQAVEA
uniref:Uncharacterized protein n=1 Tax=Haptolina brevifila TaxID=156173 RepID=A0A7S2JHI9_9EUKA|mmetsp:Transcript_82669/g.164965  ORF Transcript_82669/g.164965 Transcript_82669/m.164965 type:complete len:124 (+) Transcript_82669:380-751(+)|eukprot:CAMPEP_0174751162 /NCGR_PEP_ID=MMETSP1094-20130205/99248_1 /TAXON_ID=156173 /ORGANISM="Chrysochromulina brevifilum, Strain UTEX LB 985" /LENGTH=123 /DNA_ID=CAMNT_0015956607 /DNA_START=311 /DNA_END=678 /DNA_ORIENTATION=+